MNRTYTDAEKKVLADFKADALASGLPESLIDLVQGAVDLLVVTDDLKETDNLPAFYCWPDVIEAVWAGLIKLHFHLVPSKHLAVFCHAKTSNKSFKISLEEPSEAEAEPEALKMEDLPSAIHQFIHKVFIGDA